MRTALLLLLLAVPASSQLRSAPPYDGTAPGHPADEPGPELGSSAEDAFALLSRGDRDAARLSAARCVRADDADEACWLVFEAVEAGLEAPRVPVSGPHRRRADLHFRAGADYYFNDDPQGARREWEACALLDEGHPFCALGRRLVAVAPGGAARAARRSDRDAQQSYLSGMIRFQKGDDAGARREWKACLAQRPDADTRLDCQAALRKLDAPRPR
ncbi:MAG: hypothetical protein SF051_15885 [Elusimicrobiota bacterium]|nr:hypothetical protein [Elusimicrobiota bacterium]